MLEDVQLTEAEQAVGLRYAELYESMCLTARQKQMSDAEED